MPTEKHPKVKSELDTMYIVDDGENKFILNLEPQGYIDHGILARMLRYRADICESLISSRESMLPIKQVVLYFSKNEEVTDNKIIDNIFNNSNIHYEYDVLRAWEIDKKFILENKLEGLYALLPLMEDERKEHNKEEVFTESVEIVSKIENEALKKDILTAMSFFAEVEYPKNMIISVIRREMLMGSPLFEEWAREERKEAAEKARRETIIANTRENILDILSERFDFVPKDIRKKLEVLDDAEILNELVRKSVRVGTLEEFDELLEKVLK